MGTLISVVPFEQSQILKPGLAGFLRISTSLKWFGYISVLHPMRRFSWWEGVDPVLSLPPWRTFAGLLFSKFILQARKISSRYRPLKLCFKKLFWFNSSCPSQSIQNGASLNRNGNTPLLPPAHYSHVYWVYTYSRNTTSSFQHCTSHSVCPWHGSTAWVFSTHYRWPLCTWRTVVTEHSYSNLRPITKRKHFRGFFTIATWRLAVWNGPIYMQNAKTQRFCNCNCHVMPSFDARLIFIMKPIMQFRGVKACIGFHRIQKP